MARQKKWASEAERLAAYRARKAEVEALGDDGEGAPEAARASARELALAERGRLEGLGLKPPPAVAVEAAYADLASGELPALPAGRNAPPLEEYVAHQLAITKSELELRGVLGRDAVDDVAGRLERTERYARWRHAGFVAGEIASL
jgi:hypothetical protein